MTSLAHSPVMRGYIPGLEAPSYDELFHCMRCGLCLPTCPTFSIYRDEKASPRGRLALMRAVSEGRLGLGEGFVSAMSLCLGCLACQTACPAGVPYGSLLERAREQGEEASKSTRSPLVASLRAWLIRSSAGNPNLTDRLAPLLRVYQAVGLQRLNLCRLLPGPIGGWERLLPMVPRSSAQKQLASGIAAVPPIRGKVGLLTGCLENSLLANVPVTTARLLSLNGFEVVAPQEQVCCGALPGHLGEMNLARQLARRNIEVFEAAGVDYIVSDAAGCSAQLKEYGQLLEADPGYRDRAGKFAAKVRDATELLASVLPLRGVPQQVEMKVAYDEPCHLVHAQGIRDQPRLLLGCVPGVQLLELPESTWCCGSAGTYNLTHVAEAETLLRRKMQHVRDLAPDVLATANTGCIVQLLKGVRETKSKTRVMHVLEVVALAYV
ncbi:MAG: (Fe-S)-binding protein [Anaerolineales bacterium]